MVILSFASSLIFALLNVFSFWMISSLISTIMNPNSKLSGIQQSDLSIYDKLENMAHQLIGNGSQLEQLEMLCIILVVTFIIKNIFFLINNVSVSFVGNKMIMDIRNQFFSYLQRLPLSFFQKTKSGELSSIMMHDVNNMRTAFTTSIQSLINDPISIIVILFMLLITNVKMTLYVLCAVPIAAYVITKLGQSIRRKSMRSSIQIADLMNIFYEIISGIRIVKAFIMERFEIKRFSKENKKFFQLTFKQESMRNLTVPINDIIGILLGVLLLWIGGREVIIHGNLDSDGFIRYIIYLFAMLQPAKKLGTVTTQIQAGLASAERVFNIIDVKSNIKDPVVPKILNEFKKGITFEDVSFQYEISNQPSLVDINIKIPKGSTLAIVGSSGAGKSTFVDLIPRFHDVSDGKITIDEIDIREMSIAKLRSFMGVVSQDTILFNDTVMNNIRYGQKDTDLNKIYSAAKAANILEFINNLPNGFNTIIGEKGTRLSGGQKQRISIARAILKNPEILILDEATSALDTESERKVQKAIDKLVRHRTVIVIAHRLSTIINADQIIVLDKGHLAEMGSHDELLALKGIYKKLHDIQFGGIRSK